MDFSKLTPVSNSNPTGQNFVMKWNPAKQEFRFSDKQFNEMQLEYNSLTQYDSTDGKIYLGVCPESTGVFYKKTKGSSKGKRFKNARLSEACEVAGLDPKTLTITDLGTNGQIQMFEISSETKLEPALLSEEVPQEEEVVHELQPTPVVEDDTKDLEADVNEVEQFKDQF